MNNLSKTSSCNLRQRINYWKQQTAKNIPKVYLTVLGKSLERETTTIATNGISKIYNKQKHAIKYFQKAKQYEARLFPEFGRGKSPNTIITIAQ